MPTEDDSVLPLERRQTDESLRVEREKVDDAIGEKLSELDQTADAVITRARVRADALVAAARSKADRQSSTSSPSHVVEKERVSEDTAVRQERATADEVVRRERAKQVAVLSSEREETDRDLSSERAAADQSLATRDEFLGVVNHDLLNMLNNILGFASLIETAVARPDHVESILAHARRIRRAGTRMERLVGDLIDVASIKAGRLAVTRELGDPSQVLNEAGDTFAPQAAARGVSLIVEPPSSSSTAAFDSARILQVLSNLLGNAIKFTPAGGKVVVSLARQGSKFLFAVRDTGPGIPADKLEAIFDRFTQLNEQDRRGVGLGLYISKCIVEGHGGRIWAESRLDEGSTFYFTLPSQPAA